MLTITRIPMIAKVAKPARLIQRPKLRLYIDQMRRNIAADLDLALENVSVKATTTEGMNAEGQGLCISAQAVAQVRCAK